MSRKSSAFVPHDLKRPLAGAAKGPLAGLTCAVKDMFDIAGERAGGGSPEYLADAQPAKRHAAAVQRVLDAGATIAGKTVCDEFFFSVAGMNAHYGTPANPRAPGRIPGGSSSGSAAAVAAGACDFALGSDTGGSVRIPAALCGVFGIRPTHGRVDASGAMAMAPTFDCVGWFAPSAGMLRRIGPVLLGGKAKRAKLGKLALAQDAFAQADPALTVALEDFLGRASPVLPKTREIAVAPKDTDAWRNIFRLIQGREIWAEYGAWIERRRPNLGPGIRERLAFAATVTRAQETEARKAMAKARAQILALVPPGTAIALPTAPAVAPRTDALPMTFDDFRSRVMALTCIAGIGGLPQVTIPAASVNGCPAGLSLIGWPGGDEDLLDFAVSLASYCGA